MLEPLGLDQAQEELYRSLLRAPGSSARTLADATGLPPSEVRTGLGRLAATRLAERRDGRPVTYVAVPPDIAITALVNERQAELDRARKALPELLAEYQQAVAASRPEALVEVATGPNVGYRRFCEMQAAATEELLLFDRVSDPRTTGAREVANEAPMLGRGVRCRGIYEVSSLGVPGRLPYIRHLSALGEQGRVIRRLPMKMAICDRRMAMVPLSEASGAGPESVLLIGPSALLTGLVDLFEEYWQRATPLRASPDPVPEADRSTPDEREILRLLGTGLKDEAIARQLGVSMRTTRRRISKLLATLGVASRFQAGLVAARRNLI